MQVLRPNENISYKFEDLNKAIFTFFYKKGSNYSYNEIMDIASSYFCDSILINNFKQTNQPYLSKIDRNEIYVPVVKDEDNHLYISFQKAILTSENEKQGYDLLI